MIDENADKTTAEDVIINLLSQDHMGYADFWGLPAELIADVQATLQRRLDAVRAKLDAAIRELAAIPMDDLDAEYPTIWGVIGVVMTNRDAVLGQIYKINQYKGNIDSLEGLLKDISRR
jgi:hypothetical protein